MNTALITGASRGIGLGIARMLAEQGYGLTITARGQERLDAVTAELRDLGADDVVTVAADLADEDAPAAIAAAHAARFDRLDALILNAGVGSAGNIAEFPMKRYDKTFAVDVRAPFMLLQQCLPLLRTTAADSPRGARVIALGSITGVYAEPGLAAYGAAKAAMNSLIETLNVEESGAGISGTAIAPAFVDTDMSAWTRESVPQESMVGVQDIVEIAAMALRLSRQAVIPKIVVGRAGTDGYRA
ncbi:3-oxoacyl-ACP reductase [Mycolicibacterium chitae]|uniref:Short-chain dehydrogenase/reductase SDR n=1 Tax=Mycolicibacterium chitae TaxID=1792 RepID=A0A3S5EIA7_MYCCI|nr:SDR family oxidoreductase [Mycolicibacterium chitae]MCV7106285.1 SDR family oxidoreductase [Mycolicibacterium chitae]BBZ03800.1 3-oxoacyl-ACP reductase [Mycolicibacterium chitae]VEG47454.1 short-chain dehydrogenase/reductase SDR [Mycolicibacterium chitae]